MSGDLRSPQIDKRVESRIRELPDRPGIYVFRDEDGGALYVGKARSLCKRVATYLSGEHEPRLVAMLSAARDLEFVVTDSEADALLLENNWIKNTRPRYNILLRDDKTYPYVKLTSDPYPRVAFTRRIRRDSAEYFGPYLPGGLARKAIKLVQKLFQLRVCTIQIDGSLPRPCLYYDMRRCLGPCVEGLTTPEAYSQATAEARLFLSGRADELTTRLRSAMTEAAARLDYEEAARVRDLLAEIEAVTERRRLSTVRGDDVDIYGVAVEGSKAAVCLLVMRGGQVLDRREIFWEGRDRVAAPTVLGELLPQIYDRTTFIPKELHLPVPVEGADALTAWLGERKGERVYLRLPARGPKAERVKLANRNARMAHRRRFRGEREAQALASLRRHLGLEEAPQRIEGFDVSTLQGSKTVASMVVCEAGRMRKAGYRSFSIRDVEAPDDVASVRQAVYRRYRRRLEEVGDMPDLILIDGGRGQLNAALSALAELGVEETPCVALAKREEEVYLVDRPAPLRLPRTDPGLRLLQQIRDEAHRFAISRHRRQRRRVVLRSALDGVTGIGPKRRKLLLTHFGSLRGIRRASRADLEAVLGRTLASRLYETLHGEEAASSGSQP